MNTKRFSIIMRAKSFIHAWRGIALFIRTTHNAWLQIIIFTIAIVLGFYFHVTNIEWALIVFAGGLVFVAEALNTAIEIDMDLTSPDEHPAAKDTKDVAAGAVLISAIFSAIIGLLVFYPYVRTYFN
jgi:diacylglycerol kinase (ATP)